MIFTIKFIFFGFFYMIFRIANTLFFWRGTPNFLTWLEDSKRAEKHILLIANVIFFSLIWYFTNWWIMLIFASGLTILQYFVWKRRK